MAAITVTAANVRPGANADIKRVRWGGTVTAGQAVYSDLTDAGDHKAIDADAAATAVIAGVALTNGADGEYGVIQTRGSITIGATVVKGTTYYAGLSPGDIGVAGDLGSGDIVSVLGVASSAAAIDININNSTTVI